MRTLVTIVIFLLVIIFVGCGSSQTQVGDCQLPAWYTNLPSDPNYLFQPATETSRDLQVAINKATITARTEISRQVEVKMEAMQKKFDEETGFGKDAQLSKMYTEGIKTIVSGVLNGSKVKYQEPCQTGEIWRGTVLVEYPIGAANQALVQQLKSQEQLYTRFRASKTFEELQDDVKRFEEWKEKQGK
jgi:hypothetical protein